MSWETVGTVSAGPQDREILVGSFSLEEDDDILFLRITQTSPATPWNYSFGLVTFRSSVGQELGTTKIYGSIYGECYRLGIGRTPLQRTGSIYFTPRAYNRGWISIADPPLWQLEVEAQSGSESDIGSPPVFGTRATLGVLSNLTDFAVSYAISNGIASISLIPKALPLPK